MANVMQDLAGALTEQPNAESAQLDMMSSLDIVTLMCDQDLGVVQAVQLVLPQISRLVDFTVAQLQEGGRLFYVGAGTSGRLGMLDAAECPPTFGTPPEMVQAVLAGGPQAFLKAVEHAEDDPAAGAAELQARGFSSKDVLIGISASGRTPFVIGALRHARELGSVTGSIYCNPGSALEHEAEYPILLKVGPEVLAGSTRLKAGTATKMALNMLSTACMVRLGKTLGNLMVDLTPTCEKLRLRSVRILSQSANLPWEQAEEILARSDGDLRLATIMAAGGLEAEAARAILDSSSSVREAVERAREQKA